MSEGRVATGAGALDDMIQEGFPKGSLIVLAGGAGSGKTIFGSTFICKGIESGEAGLYVSMTENRRTFLSIISKNFARNYAQCIENEKLDFLGIETLTEGGAPAILASILRRIERIAAKRLVIDGFSVLSQAAKDKTELRSILQTIVTKLVRQLECTTMLIVEIPFNREFIGTGLEEFWADGVIKLNRDKLDERLLRKMEVMKLRGTRLSEREFIFTLEGGFKVFSPFKPKPVEKQQRFDSKPDPAGMYSSGSEDLDLFLGGGYPKGSTVLLEVGSGVSTYEYQLVIAPTTWNFMAQQRGALMIPSSGVDYYTLRALLAKGGFAQKEVAGRGKVIVLGSSVIPEDPFLVTLEGRNSIQDYQQFVTIATELRNRIGQPICYYIGYDSLIAHYGIESAIRTANFEATRVRETGELGIAIVKPGYRELSEKLGAVTDIHLKMIVENGVLILYGIKPRTNLHAVEMDSSKGYALPKLTSIV